MTTDAAEHVFIFKRSNPKAQGYNKQKAAPLAANAHILLVLPAWHDFQMVGIAKATIIAPMPHHIVIARHHPIQLKAV